MSADARCGPRLDDVPPARSLWPMTPEDFRRHAHELVDWMADYMARVGELPVTPPVAPGDIRRRLPSSPPEAGEPFASLFQDFRDLIVPGMTHWGHPGLFAYFPGNNSPPSILAEMLTATIGAQCMSWQTSPAATELEQVTMDWLRQMVGLPAEFIGVIQDTSSTATLVALLTAREHATGFAGLQGMSGGPASPSTPRVSGTHRWTRRCSSRATASSRLRLIDLDDDFAMRPLRAGRGDRRRPRVGTACRPAWSPPPGPPVPPRSIPWPGSRRSAGATGSGSTSMPPTRDSAAILPEKRWIIDGVELADSFVLQSPQVDAGQLRLLGVLREGRRRAALAPSPRARNTSAPRTTTRSPTSATGASSSAAGSGRSSSGGSSRATVSRESRRSSASTATGRSRWPAGSGCGARLRAAGAGAAGAGVLPPPAARRARTWPP